MGFVFFFEVRWKRRNWGLQWVDSNPHLPDHQQSSCDITKIAGHLVIGLQNFAKTECSVISVQDIKKSIICFFCNINGAEFLGHEGQTLLRQSNLLSRECMNSMSLLLDIKLLIQTKVQRFPRKNRLRSNTCWIWRMGDLQQDGQPDEGGCTWWDTIQAAYDPNTPQKAG